MPSIDLGTIALPAHNLDRAVYFYFYVFGWYESGPQVNHESVRHLSAGDFAVALTSTGSEASANTTSMRGMLGVKATLRTNDVEGVLGRVENAGGRVWNHNSRAIYPHRALAGCGRHAAYFMDTEDNLIGLVDSGEVS